MLDITSDELRTRFQQGVRNIASLSLAIGYPTKASVPHMVANAFKNLLAVAAVTDVTFAEAEKVISRDNSKRFYSSKNTWLIHPSLRHPLLQAPRLRPLPLPRQRKKKQKLKKRKKNPTKTWDSDCLIRTFAYLLLLILK